MSRSSITKTRSESGRHRLSAFLVTIFINKPQTFGKFVSAFDFLFFRKRHRCDSRWCKTFILCKQVSVFCNHIFSYTSIKNKAFRRFLSRRHIWASCYSFNLEICIKCTRFSRESWYNSTLTICNRKCYNLSIDISAQNGDDFLCGIVCNLCIKGNITD